AFGGHGEVNSEVPCEVNIEAPWKVNSEAPWEVNSEAPCEVDSEAPCEVNSEASCEVDSEAPCEVNSEAPCEVNSEAPCLHKETKITEKSSTYTGQLQKANVTILSIHVHLQVIDAPPRIGKERNPQESHRKASREQVLETKLNPTSDHVL
ncbi:potassium voltage-gated channel protein Shal-like X3, partial [Biomphalaria pfeifferi]